MKSPNIIQDEKNHEFYCIIEGQKCFVHYTTHPGALEFSRTFVPEELRRRGIARILYDEIATYLKMNNLKAIPLCSYAQKYFEKHKELVDTTKNDSNMQTKEFNACELLRKF